MLMDHYTGLILAHVAGAILRGEWVGLNYDTSDARRIHSQAAYLQASQRLKDFGGNWANVEPVIRVGKLTRMGCTFSVARSCACWSLVHCASAAAASY